MSMTISDKSYHFIKQSWKETVERLEGCGVAFASVQMTEDYHLERMLLCKHGDYVQVFELKVLTPNMGYGTRLMNDLTAIADFKRWTLTLTPDLGLGATSIARLKRFYRRFGFRENKGRNTDFSVNDSMIRKPSNNH